MSKARWNKQQSHIDKGQADENELLIASIQQDVDSIDKAYSDVLEPPNLQYIEQMVVQRQALNRRKLHKELIIFVLVAIVLVTGGMLVAYSSLTIYGILQVSITFFALSLIVIRQLHAKGREITDDNR